MMCDLSKWSWRLVPGSFATIGVTINLLLGVFQPLEQVGYQALFRFRGVQAWDDRVVLVAIDDQSIAQLGRFPWSRQQYVKLLNTLSGSEGSIVVFDLLFSEPSHDDDELATAIAKHGQVILAQAYSSQNLSLSPVPQLKQNALAVGHILTQQDSDGLVRQISPFIHQTPALGLAAAQAYSLTEAQVTLPLSQPLRLNWIGSAATMPHYSFADVIADKVPRQAFQHKIVLIGVTATGIDTATTPFDRNPMANSVLLHATLIQNLLQQNLLRPLPLAGYILLFILAGPLLSWSLIGRGVWRQTAVVAACSIGWIILCLLMLGANLLLPVATPLILFFVTGCFTGIYDRLRESAAFQHQLALLQRNEVLKEEFFRTASHELRAPVSNIQNAIALLKTADSPEDWEEYLQILEAECQQESALINDLLDFQRLNSARRQVEPTIYGLQDWLAEVISPFAFRAKAVPQQFQLNSEAVDLMLDWTSLRRVVSELLHNACKYTPPQETIQLTAHLQGTYLQLEVRNSGVTLPAEELSKIFDPFYRVLETDLRQQGGTGLGLAIVKRLVEQLSGTIQVMSQTNAVVFTVRLPVVVVPQSQLEPIESALNTDVWQS